MFAVVTNIVITASYWVIYKTFPPTPFPPFSCGLPSGQLMALVESSLPYALRVMCDGMIETIGKATFDGKLNIPFTAHPKKDPVTGKLYGFGYQVHPRISQMATNTSTYLEVRK